MQIIDPVRHLAFRGFVLSLSLSLWSCSRDGDPVDSGQNGSAGQGGNGRPVMPSTMGAVGEPCVPEGAHGCAGFNQQSKLLCSDGVWQADGQCGSGERCDTREENAGTCESVVTECDDSSPGEAVCRDEERFECGPDLLTRENVEVCELGCLEGRCRECEPGASECVGNGVRTCNAAAMWEREACEASAPHCFGGVCGQPPSCENLAANCGPTGNGSCCTSRSVQGEPYELEFSSRILSDFRLDNYQVTVGRFRTFVEAMVQGWHPAEGSGKHVHLHSGAGLRNSVEDSPYELGWNDAWNQADETHRMYTTQEDWDTALACGALTERTWTSSPGDNENRPINCVNWYQAYAFCIWDGGFLPSVTEGEYAALGGSEVRAYPWSAPPESTTIDCSFANYSGGEDSQPCYPSTLTTNVGTFSPQGDGRWGHADLVGNVWEWTLDVSPAPRCDDCAHLPLDADYRIARGNSFFNPASDLLSFPVFGSPPHNRSGLIGFRCARAP